jgi:hypothetical protein
MPGIKNLNLKFICIFFEFQTDLALYEKKLKKIIFFNFKLIIKNKVLKKIKKFF